MEEIIFLCDNSVYIVFGPNIKVLIPSSYVYALHVSGMRPNHFTASYAYIFFFPTLELNLSLTENRDMREISLTAAFPSLTWARHAISNNSIPRRSNWMGSRQTAMTIVSHRAIISYANSYLFSCRLVCRRGAIYSCCSEMKDLLFYTEWENEIRKKRPNSSYSILL